MIVILQDSKFNIKPTKFRFYGFNNSYQGGVSVSIQEMYFKNNSTL